MSYLRFSVFPTRHRFDKIGASVAAPPRRYFLA